MLIKVQVKPNSKHARVEKLGNSSFLVLVDEVPVEGRANRRLLEILSEYFGIPKSKITIVRGAKTPDKIVHLPDFSENPIENRAK